MRTVFAEKMEDDRVTIAEGTFERVDVKDGWADLIVIAQVSRLLTIPSLEIEGRIRGQAFHWCPDYEKAAQEFARILKPQGTLAFIWYLEDRWASYTLNMYPLVIHPPVQVMLRPGSQRPWIASNLTKRGHRRSAMVCPTSCSATSGLCLKNNL